MQQYKTTKEFKDHQQALNACFDIAFEMGAKQAIQKMAKMLSLDANDFMMNEDEQ